MKIGSPSWHFFFSQKLSKHWKIVSHVTCHRLPVNYNRNVNWARDTTVYPFSFFNVSFAIVDVNYLQMQTTTWNTNRVGFSVIYDHSGDNLNTFFKFIHLFVFLFDYRMTSGINYRHENQVRQRRQMRGRYYRLNAVRQLSPQLAKNWYWPPKMT